MAQGIYNVHVNIETPGKFLNNQMRSIQAPFFFGGSQVPINLNYHDQVHEIHGEGFKNATHSLFRNNKTIYPSSRLRK